MTPAAKIEALRKPRAGYSLVEVIVAAGLVAIGIGAAAVLSLTMVSQQEGSARVVRALNYQEQACRLWQLGVSTADISTILPVESSLTNLAFNVANVAIANLGTVEKARCTATITAGSRFSTGTARTNTMVVVRPSTR